MKPSVVFFSDFGLDSGFVASMHGVCKQVDPALDLYDGSHQLRAFDIRHASSTLNYTVPYWPSGTVFVCVVDPGVGTDRKACVARLTNGTYIVTPDNGTLTLLKSFIGIDEVRQIDESVNRFAALEEVNVFHGRDVFAYCGARLAAGIITFEEVGPRYDPAQIVLHTTYPAEVSSGKAVGVIEEFDPFGTAETNIRNADFQGTGFEFGDVLRVRISRDGELLYDDTVTYDATFGCVPRGEAVIFNDLAFHVAIGINQGSLADTYGLDDGPYDITIERTGSASEEK